MFLVGRGRERHLFVPHESKNARLAWNVRWLDSALPTVFAHRLRSADEAIVFFPVNEIVPVLTL